MDEGAVVAWPERHNHDELSGLQHAVNRKLQDEAAFWAEYQNEPLVEEAGEAEALDADDIAGKTNGRRRAEVPVKCEPLTAFIDVQQKCCSTWWRRGSPTSPATSSTTGPTPSRAWPTSPRGTFSARSGASMRGRGPRERSMPVWRPLSRTWLGWNGPREDGAVLRVDLCLIDQGWQTDVVHQFCRQSEHAAVLMPSRGHGVTASQRPVSEYVRSRGDRIDHHWWIPSVTRKRALRHVEIDTNPACERREQTGREPEGRVPKGCDAEGAHNYWKSFVHERLATAMGDPGCLSIFGPAGRGTVQHRLFAEHLTSEYRVRTEGRSRTVDEWKLPAHKPDNHWFDCLVGCAAAASMRGISLGAVTAAPVVAARKRKRLKLSELQRAKRR